MDGKSAGRASIPSGGPEADHREPDERLRCIRRFWRVPRWVPHTTPSSLLDQRDQLAGADHQLAGFVG